MSEMDKDTLGNARVDAPIVLVIGERSQGYLDDNEVLRVMYGERAPKRVLLPQPGERADAFAWEFFYPLIENPERKLRLLERFDRVSVNQLQSFLRSHAFHASVYDYILEATGLSAEDETRVRVIVCNEGMLSSSDLPMRSVAQRYFPNAVLFTVENDRSVPKRFVPEEESSD